jgi:hypothetical protein
MLTKKLELKDRADQILKVLFDNTLHTGHWTKVQFGSSKKFVERDNGILSLLVLTWLRQLQQFFLNDEHKAENGDWNTLGKYTGTTSNLLKETPLANINFSTASETTTLQQITNINQFKPKEDIKGVCTSLEEWALRILSPETELQVDELYNNDAETHARVERVIASEAQKPQQKFQITTTVLPFTEENIDSTTEEIKLDGLDTTTRRNDECSNQELALMVNKILIESLEKADKIKKTKKKPSIKEIENMKKAYNAASAFTTIMNNVLNSRKGYVDFQEMNRDMLDQINMKTEVCEVKESDDKEEESSDSSYSETETPPPQKKRKSGVLSTKRKTGKKLSDNDDKSDNDGDSDYDDDEDN